MVMPPEKQQADSAIMLPTRSEYADNTVLHSWQVLPSYQEPRQQTPPSTFRGSSSTPQIAQGCLLLPVGLAFWWYWTKRMARRVVRHLLPSSSSTNTANTTTRKDGCSATISCSDGGQHFANDDSDSIYVSASDSRDRHHQHQHQHYHHHEEEKGCSGSFSSQSFDHFESWEDVVIEQDGHSNHLRLVQWIKGRNHFGTTRRMRAISKQTLHRREKRNRTNAPPSNVGDVDNFLRQRSMPMLSTSDSSSEDNRRINCEGSGTTPQHDWQCIEDVTGFELCETDYQQQQNVNLQSSSTTREEDMHGKSCYGCSP